MVFIAFVFVPMHLMVFDCDFDHLLDIALVGHTCYLNSRNSRGIGLIICTQLMLAICTQLMLAICTG